MDSILYFLIIYRHHTQTTHITHCNKHLLPLPAILKLKARSLYGAWWWSNIHHLSYSSSSLPEPCSSHSARSSPRYCFQSYSQPTSLIVAMWSIASSAPWQAGRPPAFWPLRQWSALGLSLPPERARPGPDKNYKALLQETDDFN